MTLLIILLLVVPGIGATLAVFKAGEAKLPTQLACMVGLGYVVVAAWAFILVLFRQLNPFTFFLGIALLTPALWILGLRRSGMRERGAAISSEIRSDGLLLLFGSVTIGVAAFGLLRGQSSPLLNFGVANPFRYWADALEVAEIGAAPSQTLQWGNLFAPTVSKLGFNALNGAFSYLSDDPLRVMGPMLGTVLVGAAFAGWGLGREMGLRMLAPLLSILAVSDYFGRSLVLTMQQKGYLGETFARFAVATGLLLALNALHNEDRRRVAVASGVTFGIAGSIHLIPTVVGMALLASYCLFYLITQRDRFRHVMRSAGVAGAIFGAFVLSGLFLSGGDPAFDAIDREQRIGTSGGTFDPTRYLATGEADQPPELWPEFRATLNDGWYELPGVLFRDYVSRTFSVELEGWVTYLLFFGVGALATLLLFLAPKRLRPLAVSAFTLWAGIFLVTLAMSYVYETYVPAAFPRRRLWAYAGFFPLLVILASAQTALHRLARLRSRLPAVVGGVILVALTVLSFPPEVSRVERMRGAHSLTAMNWISENLPCDARIAANQRTGGIFQAIAGRVSVVEGMAPYIRPEMLKDVTDLLLEFRSYFQTPDDHDDVLTKYGVSHVVVVKKDYLLNRRPPLLGKLRPDLMRRTGGLEQIYESTLMDVYRVPDADTSAWPQPEHHAGYHCRTLPLELPSLATGGHEEREHGATARSRLSV